MNLDYLVFDLETQRTFEEVGGRYFRDLGVSVCCLYRSSDQEYYDFLESELGRMENLFLETPLIVGFNIRKFDLPVLQPYFTLSVESLQVFDLLEDLTEKLGHRVSLDSVAQATLQIGKTATGLQAIQFFRQGKWKELKDYCRNDVKVTKEIFDFGLKNGEVFYLSREGGKKLKVEVDWLEQISQKEIIQAPAQYKLL